MSQDRTLYEILGVPHDAKPHAIKAAYRAEAMRYHPDRLPHDASDEDRAKAQEQFQAVKDAYDVLMDRERREQYDLSGRMPKTKAQLATDAAAFLLQAFTAVVSQMADMMVQNPHVAGHIRSPVAIIEDSINERILSCQTRVRTARDKRKMLKRVVKGLRRKDGSDAAQTPVLISLNGLIKNEVNIIVDGETEVEMLRLALKLNSEWDYTKPMPEADDYDEMVSRVRLAYGDTNFGTVAPPEPESEADSGPEEDGEWPEWGDEPEEIDDDSAVQEQRA